MYTVKNPVTPKPNPKTAAICTELQRIQKIRVAALKSRIMCANRLRSVIAAQIGFKSNMDEAERKKIYDEAAEIIKQESEILNPTTPRQILIRECLTAVKGFDNFKKGLEKEMKKLAEKLPAAKWVEGPRQRGFGILFLAVIIGETGDLANYSNPGKVWRRLGCAPWTFDGKTAMGATWRGGKEGKLPAAEWESYGYNPRRRSIAYLIGEGIVKQNDREYRSRYDATKAACAVAHPDYTPLRCHLHGMLLATKLLLKNLWIEWNQ